MIKVVIILLFTFNILACNPIQQVSQQKSTTPQVPFTCLASQSRCEVSTELGTFTIEFSGQIDAGKVKTELPFEIQLSFDAMNQNAQLKSVSSYLEGKTMFMGKIPVFFQRAERSSESQIAQTLLANCSEDIMTWRLWFTVDIEQVEETTKQDFFIDFDSQRL